MSKNALLLLFALTACSSEASQATPKEKTQGPSSDPAPNAPAADKTPPADAGAPSPDAGAGEGPQADTYAKFHPAPPQLASSGGHLLAHPKFQAITFANDPLRTQIDTFTEKIGASAYWSATTKEYGIAAGSALAPMHLTGSAPPTVDDSDIKSWLAGKLDAQTSGFAAPDDDTLYVVYFPSGTTVTNHRDVSCKAFGGYHDEVQLGSGQVVSYAVIARCANFNGFTGLDAVTAAASHEMFEGVTDPRPNSDPGWDHVDDDHFAWGYVFLPEGGDLCVQAEMYTSRPTDLGFLVQRTWSNSWAKTGHHPCVPGAGGTYFNTAPVLPDAVTVSPYNGAFQVTTRGIKIPVGQTRTIDLQLFSDGPTSDWEVTVIDWAGLKLGDGEDLDFSLDRSRGNNGDVLKLTISALRSGSVDGFSPFVIASKSGTTSTLWPAIVTND